MACDQEGKEGRGARVKGGEGGREEREDGGGEWALVVRRSARVRAARAARVAAARAGPFAAMAAHWQAVCAGARGVDGPGARRPPVPGGSGVSGGGRVSRDCAGHVPLCGQGERAVDQGSTGSPAGALPTVHGVGPRADDDVAGLGVARATLIVDPRAMSGSADRRAASAKARPPLRSPCRPPAPEGGTSREGEGPSGGTVVRPPVVPDPGAWGALGVGLVATLAAPAAGCLGRAARRDQHRRWWTRLRQERRSRQQAHGATAAGGRHGGGRGGGRRTPGGRPAPARRVGGRRLTSVRGWWRALRRWWRRRWGGGLGRDRSAPGRPDGGGRPPGPR